MKEPVSHGRSLRLIASDSGTRFTGIERSRHRGNTAPADSWSPSFRSADTGRGTASVASLLFPEPSPASLPPVVVAPFVVARTIMGPAAARIGVRGRWKPSQSVGAMPTDDIPDPSELRAELAKLAAAGCSIADLPTTPKLAGLAIVHAEAKGSRDIDKRIALVAVIREAVEYLGEGPTGQAVRELLGLTSHTRGLLLKDRRELAADVIGVQAETFRKTYERKLLTELADELYRLEAERRIPVRVVRPKRGPASVLDDLRTATGGKSLNRREAEARLWALAYDLRADLLAVARLQAEGTQEKAIDAQKHSGLWRYARFYDAFARFTDDFGTGLVMAGNEVTVQEAGSLLGFRVPLSDEASGLLRASLSRAEASDVAAWITILPASILEAWAVWLG